MATEDQVLNIRAFMAVASDEVVARGSLGEGSSDFAWNVGPEGAIDFIMDHTDSAVYRIVAIEGEVEQV